MKQIFLKSSLFLNTSVYCYVLKATTTDWTALSLVNKQANVPDHKYMFLLSTETGSAGNLNTGCVEVEDELEE